MCKIIDKGETEKTPNFYAAGLYLNQQNNNIVLVEDFDQNSKHGSKKNKLPGGKSDSYAHYDQEFLKTLGGLLQFYEYEGSMVGKLQDYFREKALLPVERVAIIEYLEETGYLPVQWLDKLAHQTIINRENKSEIFHQYFIWITCVIGQQSKHIDDCVEPVHKSPFNAYEKSIRAVLSTPVKDVLTTLIQSHRVPVKELFGQQYACSLDFYNKYSPLL